MAKGQIKKVSLFSETWNALKSSWTVWWHWALGVGLIMGAVNWCHGQRTPEITPFIDKINDQKNYLKDHPDQWQPFIHAVFDDLVVLAFYLALTLLIQSVAYYFVTVNYLRFSGAKPQQAYTVEGYLYWFKKILWKYTKPGVWTFLPFIGIFFYIRSTIRYALVTPMTMLAPGDELQKSWDMTEGNWWRIFLNQMGINIAVMLLVWIAAIVPLLAVLIIAYGNSHAPLVRGAHFLVHGLAVGVGMAVGSLYTCNAYRVLKQEGKAGS